MKIFYGVFIFIIGSVMASFYGVVATRLPLEKSIIKPGSHCDHCHHALKWYELIPIFSFLTSLGKCRYCHHKLPIYEPIIELLLGVTWMIAYFYFDISYAFFISLILSSLLVLIFISDFKYMIILDSPLIISVFLIFILKWFYFGIGASGTSLLSGLILFLFMFLIGYLGSKVFNREALGGGDIKLSFVIGMLLGIPHGFIALILSTFLALPYATFSLLTQSERVVPYGPFLIGALCLVFVYFDKFTYIINLFTYPFL